MATAPHVSVVPADDLAWDAWLDGVPRDVYHLAGYSSFAAGSGEGHAFLVVVGDRDRGIAWPYLVRPIEGTDATDITCVYGYPGPVAWGVAPGEEFLDAAWREIVATWRAHRSVSAFTRFHPLLGNVALAASLPVNDDDTHEMSGALVPHGQTVSIDCTLSDEDARALYNRTLRQQIAASRRAGLATTIDEDWSDVSSFVDLYREAMTRHGAAEHYFLDEEDVLRLRESLDGHLHMFVTRVEGGEIAAAALNTEFNGTVQAHLIGVNPKFRQYSPQKVLTDDSRSWAHGFGAQVLHLGGGLGGAEDSLFAFKKRFSDRRHAFFTGRWVLDRDAYRELSMARGTEPSELTAGFFPAYRGQPSQPLD